MLKAFENTKYICIYTQCLLIMNNFGEHLQKISQKKQCICFDAMVLCFPPPHVFFSIRKTNQKTHVSPPLRGPGLNLFASPTTSNHEVGGEWWYGTLLGDLRYPISRQFWEWFSELPIRWDMLIHRNKNVDDFILQDNSRSSKVCAVVLSWHSGEEAQTYMICWTAQDLQFEIQFGTRLKSISWLIIYNIIIISIKSLKGKGIKTLKMEYSSLGMATGMPVVQINVICLTRRSICIPRMELNNGSIILTLQCIFQLKC